MATRTKNTEIATPTRAELVARARDLVPVLRQRAAATETAGTMLEETKRDLLAAGLFRIVQARSMGGYELDVATHIEVAAEIARGCASAAWILGLLGMQNWMLGYYPPEAQREIVAAGTDLITCLVMGPQTTAARAEGGWRLSGKWPYVSGVDQCNWLMLSAFDPDIAKDQAPRVLTFLLPRSAASLRVLDDWHVLGLRGTGSKSLTLTSEFVPPHRVMAFWEADVSGAPGFAVNTGPLYAAIPRIPFFCMVVAAPSIGIASMALDSFRERLTSRRNAFMNAPQSEAATAQMRLGQATARLDAARRLLIGDAEDYSTKIAARHKFTLDERALYRQHMADVLAATTAIVMDLFFDAGTGATFDASPLQRALRDILALRSHVGVNPDNASENLGRVVLGLAPKPPFI